MNPAQLSAFFAAHKVAILGGGAAAIAALGLHQRKKNAAASTTAGATIPGTIPAAAVVGGTGSSAATYDSTAFDIYDSLEQQISDVASRQQTSSPTTASSATPGPIASTLFAPTGQGPLVHFGNGTIAEVESDGSLYGESLAEWQAQGSPTNYTSMPGLPAGATLYTRATNLQNKIKSAPSTTVTQATGA